MSKCAGRPSGLLMRAAHGDDRRCVWLAGQRRQELHGRREEVRPVTGWVKSSSRS